MKTKRILISKEQKHIKRRRHRDAQREIPTEIYKYIYKPTEEKSSCVRNLFILIPPG